MANISRVRASRRLKRPLRVELLEERELLSQTDGLLAYWPLDEGTGTVAGDFSGNGHDGTLVNGPTWTTDQTGTALSFDGVNDRVVVPDDPGLDLGSSFTLAAWVKPSRLGNQAVIKKGQSTVDGYELSLSSSGTVFVRLNQYSTGSTYRVDSYSIYPSDGSRWMHIAATYDGTLLRLYVDGVEDNAKYLTFRVATNDVALALGSDDTGHYRYRGAVDSPQIYNRALSDAEIQALAGTQAATKQFLQPIPVSTSTADKPQSKIWLHDGTWWSVLPTTTGTWLWRLDDTAWTAVLKLSGKTNVKADAKEDGNLTHILLYAGTSSQFVTVEYLPGELGTPGTYQFWSVNPVASNIKLESGVETATIDVDSTGRMWLASDATYDVLVRYSDSPYTTWSAPINLASGISSDDISVVTALPNGTVGVMWSNQVTQRFGFRTHADGTDPTIWSADEVPASDAALAVGNGMADDHLNVAVASDSTLYAAVKTSYDTKGFTKIGLLVRRPTGNWDPVLYHIDGTGTRPIVLLNEVDGRLRVAYTKDDFSNDILYQESALAPISFGPRHNLIPGKHNNVTSTKQNVTNDVVFLAAGGSPLMAAGVRMIFPVPTTTTSGATTTTNVQGMIAAASAERILDQRNASDSRAGGPSGQAPAYFDRRQAISVVIIAEPRGWRLEAATGLLPHRKPGAVSLSATPFGELDPLFLELGRRPM